MIRLPHSFDSHSAQSDLGFNSLLTALQSPKVKFLNVVNHGLLMQNPSFKVINLSVESAMAESYTFHRQGQRHEIRISTMTEAYYWHFHPDSDESFLALEGGLFIDFDDQTVELLPGHMITVNRGVRHRTRPIAERSVNLTFERAGTRSETLTAPRE